MEREGTISADDRRLWLTTDDLDEALAHIRAHTVDRFGLLARRHRRPSRILGEPRVVRRPAGPA